MKKGIALLLLASFLALVGCNNKEGEAYKKDLQDVADKMLDNAAEVEVILDQYATVWDRSIKSKGAIPVEEMSTVTGFEQDVVEEYFEINAAGNIPKDFSTNIHSLNSYYDGTGKLKEIQDASDDVKTKINELNKPPEGYKKVYDELLDMYTYTEEYLEMALNPSGSLQSFNEGKNQLTSDISSKYKRVEAVMPNKE